MTLHVFMSQHELELIYLFVRCYAMTNEMIAVIDDDADQRELIQEILDDYVVRCFPTTEAFFSEHSQLGRPSLLLCDIQMEGIDGYETCRRVRQDASLSQLPIILISGLPEKANFTEAVEAGANEYMSKPFHVSELKELVEKQLTLSKAATS